MDRAGPATRGSLWPARQALAQQARQTGGQLEGQPSTICQLDTSALDSTAAKLGQAAGLVCAGYLVGWPQWQTVIRAPFLER